MTVPLISLFSNGAQSPNPIHSEVQADEVAYVNHDLIKWAETVYPGAQITTVFGDPKVEGLYAIRFKFPADFVVQPHTHSQDEYMTILEGSLYVGIGETVDKMNGRLLKAGEAVGIPANVPHYAWTTEPMVMQIHAKGPRDTTFCHHHP